MPFSHEPIVITGKRGNAVLISEDDWRSIQETIYLLNIPGVRESIREGLATPIRIEQHWTASRNHENHNIGVSAVSAELIPCQKPFIDGQARYHYAPSRYQAQPEVNG